MTVASIYGPRISAAARRVPVWPVYVLGFVPLAWLIWATATGQLGVDPVKTLEHDLGLLSLRFLLGSLVVTPLMRFGRINLMKFRKALGLIGFTYLVLHFSVWLLLDLQLRWGRLGPIWSSARISSWAFWLSWP